MAKACTPLPRALTHVGSTLPAICFDATTTWRLPFTRCDVWLNCRGEPSAASIPSHWSTWWVLDGGDHYAPLRAMDRACCLDDQVREVQEHMVYVLDGTPRGFKCFLTADGKGMQSSNQSPGKKCWLCDDSLSLEPGTIAGTVRYGAFLGSIPPVCRVGDFVHCTARVTNCILVRAIVSSLCSVCIFVVLVTFQFCCTCQRTLSPDLGS